MKQRRLGAVLPLVATFLSSSPLFALHAVYASASSSSSSIQPPNPSTNRNTRTKKTRSAASRSRSSRRRRRRRQSSTNEPIPNNLDLYFSDDDNEEEILLALSKSTGVQNDEDDNEEENLGLHVETEEESMGLSSLALSLATRSNTGDSTLGVNIDADKRGRRSTRTRKKLSHRRRRRRSSNAMVVVEPNLEGEAARSTSRKRNELRQRIEQRNIAANTEEHVEKMNYPNDATEILSCTKQVQYIEIPRKFQVLNTYQSRSQSQMQDGQQHQQYKEQQHEQQKSKTEGLQEPKPGAQVQHQPYNQQVQYSHDFRYQAERYVFQEQQQGEQRDHYLQQQRASAMPNPQAQTPSPSSLLSSVTTPWIRQFLVLCHPGDVLLPVPLDYILDHFNLAQLPPVIEKIALNAMREYGDEEALHNYYLMMQQQPRSSKTSFPIYRQALSLIVRQPKPEEQQEGSGSTMDMGSFSSSKLDSTPYYLERAAQALYMLIHQRYVLSPRGLDMVRRRFLAGRRTNRRRYRLLHRGMYPAMVTPQDIDQHNGDDDEVDPIFGQCPRIECHGMPLLPYGASDQYQGAHYHTDRCVKRYCAKCQQVYYNWDSVVDGCCWGTTFAHLFLMTCGKQVFQKWLVRENHQPDGEVEASEDSIFTPRIFGFRLHPCVQSFLTSPPAD